MSPAIRRVINSRVAAVVLALLVPDRAGFAAPAALASPPSTSAYMSSPIPSGYEHQVDSPAQHAGLTGRCLKPADIKIADLPAEELDSSKDAQSMPLAIALTQYGPLVFTLAARPTFDDGKRALDLAGAIMATVEAPGTRT
jgi:hypothetical protein